MIYYIFVEPVVSQCDVDVDVWSAFSVIGDFIAVDGGELVSVPVVFIYYYFIFFCVGVQSVGTD